MYALNLWLSDQNHDLISGLIRNLLCILYNITAVLSLMHRDHGCKCVLYELLIVTNILIC